MPDANPNSPQRTGCTHARTRLIAKDNDAQYIECLDCGAIFEAGEIKEVKEGANSSDTGSLADA